MIPKLKAFKWIMFLVAIMLMCELAAIMVPNGLAGWGFVAPLIAAFICPRTGRLSLEYV
ncbi:hypothetical protein OAH16_00675 [bacterium]|nr:hypothetical protein [bacterium]